MSKTLDRIAALLNQAENTTNEAEATAFMEAAQRLATQAQIELEVARQHQRDKTKRETPIKKRITLAARVGYSGRVENNAPEKVGLFLAVARSNNVRCDISHKSLYVVAYGMPSDIEVCEALYGSLLYQMQAACDAALPDRPMVAKYDKWGDYKGVGREDARVFRTAFYKSFASRIDFRLYIAAQEAKAVTLTVTDTETAEAVETTGTLVLVGKDAEISDFYKQSSSARGSYRGGQRATAGSYAGSSAGRKAGDAARLGANIALPSARQQVG